MPIDEEDDVFSSLRGEFSSLECQLKYLAGRVTALEQTAAARRQDEKSSLDRIMVYHADLRDILGCKEGDSLQEKAREVAKRARVGTCR